MKYYENIEAVQSAYLAKALASERPTSGFFRNGKLISCASGNMKSLPFHVENCPDVVKAKVANKYITDGKIKDEAPVEIIEAPSDYIENQMGGHKDLFAFTTPGLDENNLKTTAIEKGLLSSVVTFPKGHNFACRFEEITVSMFQSVFGGYYTEIELPEQDKTKCLEKYTSEIKSERNARISDTDDYERLSDITVQRAARSKREALTDEEKAEVLAYRKALRDFPESEGFPFADFPQAPSCIEYEVAQKISQRERMEEMR